MKCNLGLDGDKDDGVDEFEGDDTSEDEYDVNYPEFVDPDQPGSSGT